MDKEDVKHINAICIIFEELFVKREEKTLLANCTKSFQRNKSKMFDKQQICLSKGLSVDDDLP